LLSRLRNKLTYANVLATVCVFMMLGGSAFAAATITGKNIKNSSITGKDVKNKSLTKKDFKGSVRGRRGATGPAGPSVTGQITVVNSPQVAFGPSDVVQSAAAFCPAGQRVVSGGGASISDEQLAATEATGDRSGWFVIGVDQVDNGGEYVQAEALCAPTGQAIAASSKARTLAKIAKLEASIKAERR
jgi:hypothetical protein